ncbi:MAG: glycosyltransferase [Verrucomicrobiaceae bacterium]|nr:glycosyltransferase [Verrucomicrobiaceae bacterium]
MPYRNGALKSQHSYTVLHVIPGLGGGGAENFLRNLASAMRHSHWRTVIVVADVGSYHGFADELRSLGCTVYDLGCPYLLQFKLWKKVWKLIQAERPDVLQSWMHHADVLGSVTGTLAGVPNIVWGVRASEIHRNPTDGRLKTYLFHQALKWGSRLVPRVIVTNSEQARKAHLKMGYREDVWVRVPNGVDYRRFVPDEQARREVRQELDLAMDRPVIGFVGRFHPVKDLECFFRAVKHYQQQRKDVQYLLVGGKPEDLCAEARQAWNEVPDKSGVKYVPFASQMERYYPAMDVFTLCSRSEAFPNVVLEAMSCGLPCVTTDAGDCQIMLDGLGVVVPCRDAVALAAGWERKLSLNPERRAEIVHNGRLRIQQEYTLSQAAEKFIQLYDTLVTG